jgi:hypothetical protein
MTTMSDQELADAEALLRQRLAQLASHAPTAVHLPDEVPVIAVNRPNRRGRRAGVIAAVTALIGAGGFTTYSFLGASNDAGAATPQEAVQTFISAAEHEDVLGMIDVTAPEEVAALHAALDSITADAQRIGALGTDLHTSGVQGVDVSADDLTLQTEFLEGGLASVRATSGTISVTFDAQKFPFGDNLRAVIGADTKPGTASTTLSNDDPIALLMTVQRDGRWYVSLEYTAAEYLRRANGWEAPGPVSRTPVGFDSPEAAVTGFYERLATLDFQSVLDTIAPGEDAMAWLSEAWLADAKAAIDRGRVDGWSVNVSGLTYETVGTGDHLTLQPSTFTISGTVPDHYSGNADPSLPTVVESSSGTQWALVPPGPLPETTDGLSFSSDFPLVGNYNMTNVLEDGKIAPLQFPQVGPQPFTIQRVDGCTTFTGNGSLSIFGIGRTPGATTVDGGYKVCDDTGASGAISVLLLTAGFKELPAVSVVQTDGKWYVSPLGTLLATAVAGLHEVKDGASLFDSPLAPFIFGGYSRGVLTAVAVGKPATGIDPNCLPALVVEGDVVTGVAADPPAAAVRACSETLSSVSAVSESGSASGPVVVEEPASSLPTATIAP